MDNKQCVSCRLIKPASSFYARKDNGKLRGKCNDCHAEWMRWHSSIAYNKPYGRSRQLYNAARCRANKRGISFDLEFGIVQVSVMTGICQKSGLPFQFDYRGRGRYGPFSPSIDKISPDDGYVNNNVQIVSHMYNMGKSDHDEIDFIAMCCAVAERHRDSPAVIQRLKELRNAEF